MARFRLIGLTGFCLGVAGCTPAPIDYIPAQERAMLQSQGHAGGAGGRPISVDQMLQRARTPEQSQAEVSQLLIHFENGAVMPDDAQKQSIDHFAAAAQGETVTVVGQKGEVSGPYALLGQRRAVAVARLLSVRIADVQVRFQADQSPDSVAITTDAVGRPGWAVESEAGAHEDVPGNAAQGDAAP